MTFIGLLDGLDHGFINSADGMENRKMFFMLGNAIYLSTAGSTHLKVIVTQRHARSK